MLIVVFFSLPVGLVLGFRCPVLTLLPAAAGLEIAKVLWLSEILSVSGPVSVLTGLLSLQLGYAISTFGPLLTCGRDTNSRTYPSAEF